MAATRARAPGAAAAWQRLSCSGASWGIHGVSHTDRTDPAACYLVTARTIFCQNRPVQVTYCVWTLPKAKSECKIHFSLIAVQEPYGAYTGRTEKPRGRKRRNQIVEIDGQTTARTGLIHFSILPVQRKYGRTEIDTEAKMTKSNSGNRRSDDGKNRPHLSSTPRTAYAKIRVAHTRFDSVTKRAEEGRGGLHRSSSLRT